MNEPSASGDAPPQPDVPQSWGCISLVALVSLAVIPAAFLIRSLAVPWYFVLLGAATWGIAVAIKRPLAAQLYKLLGQTKGQAYVSACQGLLSAILELGCAAIYLWQMKGSSLYCVLGFGVGAGSAEVVYVLAAGFFTKRDPAQVEAWEAGARKSLCVRYQVPIERFFALIGHVGSRGLVYIGINTSMPRGAILLIAALSLFTIIDGVAIYGHLRRWDWSNPIRCRAVHSFFAMVSLLELAVFLTVFHFS